jgi:hypothetical protein
MKYLKFRSSKLQTVFTFEILASRSLKLDPMLISFTKLFLFTYQTTTVVLLMVYLLRVVHRAELYLLRGEELYLLREEELYLLCG